MEFHGAARVIEIGAPEFYEIPWNIFNRILSFPILTIIFNFAGLIHFRKLIITLYLFVCLRHPVMFHYLRWSKRSMKLSPEFRGTFMNKMWTTLVVSWFSMDFSNINPSSMEFDGILPRSKFPWNTIELFPYTRVPLNCMKFHGTSNFPEKSSIELQGYFLKLYGSIALISIS